MGKYKAYPEYKDSGIEWLDSIPSSWESAPIKYMALSKTSLFLDGDWIESKDISEEGIRYITTGNVGEGFYKEQGMGFITQETFKKLNCTEVYEGDILISRLNNPIGRACIVPDLGHRIVTSVDNVIFRPDSTYDERFLVYLFSSKDYFKHTSNLARGATMQRISRGLLGNIRVVFPIKEEQIQIANFLDHETAKIDTLIEKQQQLIKLLKEKRQSVISHAVTKGLNPQAPMKDSGVEWLGEVPEHWSVCTLKRHANFIDGDRSSEYPNDKDLKDSGVLFLSSKNICDGKLNLKNANYISHQKFERLGRGKSIDGDLIVKVRGSTGRIGELAIFESELLKHSTAFINAQMMIIRVKESLNNFFLNNISQSHYWMEQLNLGAYGTAQQQLNNTVFANVVMVVPPLCEQHQINAHLVLVINRFDDLMRKANNAIALMQERRTALISAAVTGKIDVRNWQAPTSQNQAMEQTA